MLLPLLLTAPLALFQESAEPKQTGPEATWHTLEVEGQTALRFGLVPPPAGTEPVPLLLVLPPGPQDAAMAERAIELYFAKEPHAAGWAVVCPVLPEGHDAPGNFAPWLDPLLTALPEQLGREIAAVHLAGISNGGRSAMGLAGQRAERFASLTVLPGFLNKKADGAAVARVASLPVTLLVGGDDGAWVEEGRRMEKLLRERGATSVRLEVIEAQEHVLAPDLAPRIFGGIAARESGRRVRAEHIGRIESVLDELSRAAATADEDVYFDLFTPNAIFIGTDASERWTLDQFRAYAMPHFQKETAWTFVPYERVVRIDAGLELAWFDEQLSNEKYGDTRGSGVLRRVGERWRIAHYVLSFAVPNDSSTDVVRVIREGSTPDGK